MAETFFSVRHRPTSLGLDPGLPCPRALHTAVERWAACVTAVAMAPLDLATLDPWGAHIHLSRATLCNRCRIVGASPKDSLSFGRLSRALRHGDPLRWCPEDLLDVMDLRTIRKLVDRAGLTPYVHGGRPPLAVLFEHHRFRIPPPCLLALRERLLVGLALTPDDSRSS